MATVKTPGGRIVDVADIDIGSILREQQRKIEELKEKLNTARWVTKTLVGRVERCLNCKHHAAALVEEPH